jgi:hypothetical protein
MNAKSRKSPPVRIREPHLLGFILVATLVIVASVVSIGETGDAWLVALVVAVMLALAAALALDVRSRRVSDRTARALCQRRARGARLSGRNAGLSPLRAEILAAWPEPVVGGCRARLRSARRGGGCRLCADPVEDGGVALVVDSACLGVGGLEQAE